ncbi:unnamed protein product [Rotaria sordida]|uniref:F-box domain-containing protein n=1 Tax=Rotaria sordida TaxID=392033 RepID=A0A814ADX8_9BILA|nr:unnamed protein product [Rotaria sordida]CAF0925117.1 unnamed protein product [Rotaria sordida]
MKYSFIQLNNLPDEILLIILKNLHNVEVLDSLIGVNKRLNTIAYDSIFTNHLTLYFMDKRISSLPDPMLDRFCLQILPEIHHKIKWLNLESTSMERILLAINYPNLHGLGLYGIDVEKAISLFNDDIVFTRLNKRQISSLVIDISKDEKHISILKKDVNKIIFTQIFTMFNNLQYSTFGPSSMWHQQFSFDMPSPSVISSNLLELRIRVTYFTDLFYLLDGRFNQLHIFHVNIMSIERTSSTIHTGEKLPNLRCFSLYSDTDIYRYDELIVPLLHRMLNLEKLDLQLVVYRNKGFINGNDFKEDIINHMPRLNKFTFNIRLFNRCPDQINIPSNENIQYTFKDFKDNQIISCVDYFQEKQYSYCHIYSYPYRMNYYDNISNNFPGGLFKNVHTVSLFDERPFEYEFFLQIAQSFPFMKKLNVNNKKPQKNKLYRKSKNDNQNLSIIKYPHLTRLSLVQAHDDYVEQFLLHTEVFLPNTVHLIVLYEVMKKITENFTRHATRINCAKLASLDLIDRYKCIKPVKDYFPQINER